MMDKCFNEIEISHFRGFDYIKIANLTKLNVFVGSNNVGKSSILEAIFMLSGMSNPIMPARINYWRIPSANNMNSTRYLFHNIDLNNRPMLLARSDARIRRLTFYPFQQNNAVPSSDDTSMSSDIKQLNFDFDTKEEGVFFLSCHSVYRLVRSSATNSGCKLQRRLELSIHPGRQE